MMPKATVGFTDGRGRLHSTAKMATVSDIASLFGSMEGLWSIAIRRSSQVCEPALFQLHHAEEGF